MVSHINLRWKFHITYIFTCSKFHQNNLNNFGKRIFAFNFDTLSLWFETNQTTISGICSFCLKFVWGITPYNLRVSIHTVCMSLSFFNLFIYIYLFFVSLFLRVPHSSLRFWQGTKWERGWRSLCICPILHLISLFINDV